MVFHKPFVYNLATWDGRPEQQLSRLVRTQWLLSPRYSLIPPPLQDLAHTSEWVPRLEENSLRVGVVAEDRHECCEYRFVVAFIFREHSLEVCW